MGSIKNLTSKYLKQEDAKYTRTEIETAMKSIRDAIPDHHNENNSLFDVEDMNQQAFLTKMREITNSSDGSLDDEISILYSVVNSDGDDKVSVDEFSKAFDTKNNDEKVSNYELWHNLWGVEELGDGTKKTTDKDDSEEKTDEKTDETVADAEKPAENKDKTLTAKEKECMDRNKWPGFISEIEAFYDSDDENLNTPEKVVNFMISEGIITENEAEFYREAYIFSNLNDEQKTKVGSQLDVYVNKKGSYSSDTFNKLLEKVDNDYDTFYRNPTNG